MVQILDLAAAVVLGLELVEDSAAQRPTLAEVSSVPSLPAGVLARRQVLAASVEVVGSVLGQALGQALPVLASVVLELPSKAPHLLAKAPVVLLSTHSRKRMPTPRR